MSTTRFDHPRRRSTFARVALIAALTLGLLAANAAPASAAGDIYVPPPPGGGYGNGSTMSGTTRCWAIDWWPGGGIGVRGGTDIVVYPVYPACRQYQGWNWIYAGLDCTIGYDVWRFYGTVERPVEAWTVSRLDQYDACADPATNVMVNIPHADDAMVSGAPPSGMPFRYDPEGDGVTGISRNSARPVSLTTDTRQYLSSPNTPFSAGGTSCAALSTPESTIGRFFMNLYGQKGAEYDTPMGQAVRREFKQTWMRVAEKWGPTWASTMINAFTVSARNPWNSDPNNLDWVPAGAWGWANSDPNGDFIVYGDGKPCSSDLDFVTEVPPGQQATASQQKVMGACWLPIRRSEQAFQNRNTGEMWYTDNFKYPMVYAGESIPPRRSNDLERVYAFVAGLEANGRNPDVNPDNAPPGGRRLPTPVNPFTGGWDDIGGYVARHASCGTVYGALWKASDEQPPTEAFPDSVEAQVTVPIGQVGGLLRPSRVEVRLTAPTDGSTVQSVNFSGSVNAPAGFPASEWTQTPWSGSGMGSRSKTLQFFRTTNPGAPFNVTVGGTVTLRKVVTVSTTIMRSCGIIDGNLSGFSTGFGSSMGAQCSLGTSDRQVVTTKTVPIVPKYVVGTKAAPNGNFPVIGASEVPKPAR
jgi:hypothetical protein